MTAGPCKRRPGPVGGVYFLLQMTLGPYRQVPFPKRLQGPAVIYRTAVIMEDGRFARPSLPTLPGTDGTIGRQGPGVRTGRLGTLAVGQGDGDRRLKNWASCAMEFLSPLYSSTIIPQGSHKLLKRCIRAKKLIVLMAKRWFARAYFTLY